MTIWTGAWLTPWSDGNGAAFDYAIRNPQLGGLPTPEPPLLKLLPWLIEGAIAVPVVWWLQRSYTHNDPYFLWWCTAAAIYYGYFSIGLLRRVNANRALQRAIGVVEDPKVLYARILAKMKQCYWELDGPVLNPTRVRDVLRSGEPMGILWPTAMWAILEAAIARNPTVWTVSSTEWRK